MSPELRTKTTQLNNGVEMSSPLQTAIESIKDIEHFELALAMRDEMVLAFCLPMQCFYPPHQLAWEQARLNTQQVRIEWSENDNDK